MAKFFWDLNHHVYVHGIETLKRGYAAAINALLSEIDRIAAEANKYELALANGGEWIGERDEEGLPLWDQTQVYSFETDDVSQAMHEIRKAFIIALYHHWERAAAGWRASAGTHVELAEHCAELGYGPSSQLDALRHLVNYFKHGDNSKKDWLGELRQSYPAFMPREVEFLFKLSDCDVEDVANIVLASGPPDPNAGL